MLWTMEKMNVASETSRQNIKRQKYEKSRFDIDFN